MVEKKNKKNRFLCVDSNPLSVKMKVVRRVRDNVVIFLTYNPRHQKKCSKMYTKYKWFFLVSWRYENG